MADEQADSTSNPIEIAAELTIAWLSNPNVHATAEEVPAFLRTMYATVGELAKGPDAETAPAPPDYVPAVPVRSSVKPDYIISLIDGRKMKSLKRHLAKHGLTPKDYRERYGLKPDYPMVAPGYSAQRREVAQRLGLGRKRRDTPPAADMAPAAADTPIAAETASKASRRAAKPKSEAASNPVRRTRMRKVEAAS